MVKDDDRKSTEFVTMVGALSYALISGVTIEELEVLLHEAKNADQFEAGVDALVELKDLMAFSA